MKYKSQITGKTIKAYGQKVSRLDYKAPRISLSVRVPINYYEKLEAYHVATGESISKITNEFINVMADILNSEDVDLIHKVKTVSPEIKLLELKKETKETEKRLSFAINLRRLEKLT
tara:strand:+ start:506 stop:856 length:351 start_codon:yes stop_codon:yes gene_type:complete